MNFIPSCLALPDEAITVSGSTDQTLSYTIGTSTATTTTVGQFTVSGGTYCSSSDVVSSMSVTEVSGIDSSFITFDPTTRTVTWTTSDVAKAGYYTVTITGTVVQDGRVDTATTVINLSIVIPCSLSTETVTILPPSLPDVEYRIEDPGSSQVASFTVSGGSWCSSDDITTSMTVSPATSLITFDATSQTVLWSSTDIADIGEYIITVTSSVTAAQTFTQDTIFVLNAIINCVQSIDSISILASEAAPKTNYTIHEPVSSVTVPAFTQTSDWCDDTDIVYTMAVTPVFSG